MECDCKNLLDQKLLWSSTECVCTTCARIVDAHPMEQGPEWFEDENARCSPVGRHDAYIPDLPGVVLEGKPRQQRTDPHKMLRGGLKDVDQASIMIGLSPDHQMTASAKQILSDVVKARKESGKLVRTRDMKVYAAVAMYYGCKIHEQSGSRNPRTIQEVASKCSLTGKACTDVAKQFKAALQNTSYASLLSRTVTANDLFTRALARVPLSSKEKCTILNVCKDMYEHINDILAGRTPETVCCVCVFMACEREGIDVDKSVLYTACAVSHATLKNALQFLKQHLKKPMQPHNA